MARISGSDGEVTAKAIRSKSLQLFARYGFAAVSMRQIANAVGVQASTIYQYIPNKQQLLVDILDDHMIALLKAWNEQKLNPSPDEALAQFARFHIRFHIEKPDEVFISYMELRSLEPDGFKKIQTHRRKYENVLKDIIKRGMAENVFKVTDHHVTAMAILAMLTGVNTWYRSGGRLSQSKIEEIYVSMVLGAAAVTPSRR